MSPTVYVATALASLTCALYSLTTSAIVNLDGIGYLKLLPHNFAAGHLAYMPLLRALTRLLAGDGVLAGRAISILSGAFGVALVFILARRLTRSMVVSCLCALGFAVSSAWWTQATDIETYALATTALLLLLYAIHRYEDEPSTTRAFVVASALAFAVLCHVTHVLITPLVAYRLAIRSRRDAVVAVGSAGALVLALYAYAAFVVRGHDLSAAIQWVRTASHGFRDGSVSRLRDAAAGASHSLAPQLVGALGIILILIASVLRRASLGRIDWLAALLWVAPYTALGLAFFGADPERWVFLLPALWLLVGILASALPRPAVFCAPLVLAVGLSTYVHAIRPAHLDESIAIHAKRVAADVRAGDLLVFPGHDWDEYVCFYARLPCEPFPLSYYIPRDGEDAALARLAREADQAHARGGRVLGLRLFDADVKNDAHGFDALHQLGVERDHLLERVLPYLDRKAPPW